MSGDAPRPEYKDYYYILGIRPDATNAEIQDAYHDLYERYGPHVSVGGYDPEMLLKTYKDISEAYEILMDPEKRRQYDLKNREYINKGDLRSLWTRFTSSAVQKKSEEKSKEPAVDLEMPLQVTLKEAIKGAKKQLVIEEPKRCDDCVEFKPIQRMQCPNCRGLGYTSLKRDEEIELPKGMYDKMQIRFAEKGKYDLQAGHRGDLIVQISLKPHPFLGVLGRDLTCTLPLTIYEAVLGAEIEVPTATGKAFMKIQPLTQPGRVYRLKGLGLAGADQLVTIEIVVPEKLSDKQKGLFLQLKELAEEKNPREKLIKEVERLG